MSDDHMLPTGYGMYGAGRGNMTGTWTGYGMDSSGWGMGGMMGGGWMMGAGWMGETEWHIEHDDGDHFDGWMSCSGFSGSARATISGTVSDDRATFEIDMPAGSIPGDGCAATAHGTAEVGSARLRATYSGSNSCSGSFADGAMDLTRR